MIFMLIVIAIGIYKKQGRKYWISSLVAIGFQLIANVLFNAGGTLENPTEDGIITALVREITNDGPQLLWLMIPAIIFGWIIPIYIIKRGYNSPQKEEVLNVGESDGNGKI